MTTWVETAWSTRTIVDADTGDAGVVPMSGAAGVSVARSQWSLGLRAVRPPRSAVGARPVLPAVEFRPLVAMGFEPRPSLGDAQALNASAAQLRGRLLADGGTV